MNFRNYSGGASADSVCWGEEDEDRDEIEEEEEEEDEEEDDDDPNVSEVGLSKAKSTFRTQP